MKRADPRHIGDLPCGPANKTWEFRFFHKKRGRLFSLAVGLARANGAFPISNMLGQRRPSPEIYSLVVSNTQDENGEYDQLRLNVGSAYEVRIPRGQTTFARIEGIAPTDIPRATHQ